MFHRVGCIITQFRSRPLPHEILSVIEPHQGNQVSLTFCKDMSHKITPPYRAVARNERSREAFRFVLKQRTCLRSSLLDYYVTVTIPMYGHTFLGPVIVSVLTRK